MCQVTPWYFLTRLVQPSRSHRSSTWCRRVWYNNRRVLTSTALCPRSLVLLPYYFYALSLSSLVARPIGFLALGLPQSSKVTNRLGPLPLLLRLHWKWMIWIPYFHRRGGRARTVPRRCTVTHIRPFRYFGVSCAGRVLTRSGCSTRLNVLLHVSNFAPS